MPKSRLSRREFLAAVSALPAAAQAKSRTPNIVLFLVDDLGWMDLGCQGSTFYETPNVDKLARQGMRFTNAYSACPVCSPSRAALMTGKYPGSLGFTGHITAILRHRYKKHGRIIPPDDYMFLRHRETTLAEAIKPAGYVSASVGKWHLGSKSYWPDEQGFDVNVAGYDHGSPPSYFDPYTSPNWNPDIPTLEDRKPGEYLTDRLTDEAIKFIEDRREQPFLLYMSHYAVHTPLQAPEALVRKYEAKLEQDDSQFSAVYAAMIESVDQSLGRIIDTLERFGLGDDTVVIFTSDNGGAQAATRNAPLREGKGYLYEGGIRVPLIVSWPGQVEPNATSDAPVSGADLYPTIAEIAGELATPGQTDGRSLIPLLEGRQDGPGRDLYWYYPHYSPQAKQPGAAIRSGKYKLIEHYDPPSVELYDLESDIAEQTNLAERDPANASELLDRLRAWIENSVLIRHRVNPNYDPELAADERPE
ncbi:MAG: sulfatase [Acidobacteria bacterium]|nr:sulfatase [Acidobacteriota bacterium]